MLDSRQRKPHRQKFTKWKAVVAGAQERRGTWPQRQSSGTLEATLKILFVPRKNILHFVTINRNFYCEKY